MDTFSMADFSDFDGAVAGLLSVGVVVSFAAGRTKRDDVVTRSLAAAVRRQVAISVC